MKRKKEYTITGIRKERVAIITDHKDIKRIALDYWSNFMPLNLTAEMEWQIN